MSSRRRPLRGSPVVGGVRLLAAGGGGGGTPLRVEVLDLDPPARLQAAGGNLYLSLDDRRGTDTVSRMSTKSRTAPAAVAYLRVSTDEQGKSGLGLEAQESACRQAAADAGLRIVEVVREIESGSADDRPLLQQALATVSRTRGTLIVARLDRLSRSLCKTAEVLRDGHKVRVADCPNASVFELHLRAVLAQEERRLISERTRSALAAAKARGQKLGSARPGHWEGREGRRRVGAARAAEAAAAIRFVANEGLREQARPILAAHPKASLRQIGALLQAEGILTPAGCETWTAAGVARLKRSMAAAESA